MITEGFAQSSHIEIENPSFTSMVVGEGNIYAIDKNGQFYAWNTTSLNRVYTSTTTKIKFTAIAKDKNNNLFLGTELGEIYQLNPDDFSIKIHLKLKKKLHIHNIIFNSLNEIFLIVPNVIYDPINNDLWNDFENTSNGMVVKKRSLFFFRKRTNKYFIIPEYTFIDSQDRIWMTKSFGEFGGTVQVFDSKAKKELSLHLDGFNLGSTHPKSVFEDVSQNIYITSGLQHFFNFGDIYKIQDQRVSQILNSKNFSDTTNIISKDNNLFIGPGAYNPKDNKIYISTSNGFYKADIPIDGEIRNPELLFTPELAWDREKLAIGVDMVIKKLDFTQDNRLIFLTSNNGVGIYDGKELKTLK